MKAAAREARKGCRASHAQALGLPEEQRRGGPSSGVPPHRRGGGSQAQRRCNGGAFGAGESPRLQAWGPQVAPAPSRAPPAPLFCPHLQLADRGDLGGCHDFPRPSCGPPSGRLGLLLPWGVSSPQQWGPGVRTGGAVTREGALAGRRARSQQHPGRQGRSAGPRVSTSSKRTQSRAAHAADPRALPASRAWALQACLSRPAPPSPHLQIPGASVSVSQQYGLFKE